VASELRKTYGVQVNWYIWPSWWKAVNFVDSLSQGVCRNADDKSMLVINFDPWNCCSSSFIFASRSLTGKVHRL